MLVKEDCVRIGPSRTALNEFLFRRSAASGGPVQDAEAEVALGDGVGRGGHVGVWGWANVIGSRWVADAENGPDFEGPNTTESAGRKTCEHRWPPEGRHGIEAGRRGRQS